ncbi:IS30 family transposase [Rhodoferax sediminis]|uniref:IS30 family transposase n=1 Tax=Rhodoferax sediminis TaxID=2509614 RepID=A0A515DFJ2_9BURK|nr:IS30 family transposase [Rhodoferax sediminis]QDL39157.1 IS30 family transposase [Rhodoferax sediminis]
MNLQQHYNQLDYQERQTIAICRELGLSIRATARILNRAPSTISREISRNCGGAVYSSRFAHQRFVRRRRHNRAAPKLRVGNALFACVGALLRQRWSPQQIASRLATLHPHEATLRVSHETIYNVIYAQPRGELRRELIACLRLARTKRWPRSRGEDRRGQMADLLSIHLRPPEIEDRQFPGHWEGDLIKGAGNLSAVGTLVERSTRLLILVKLPHLNPATAAHVLQAFTDKLNAIAKPMRQTLTYDRGREMAHHSALTHNTGVAVYFCDPHSPWQRGTNENTNGLVRQYLPKGTDLSGYSQQQLDAIADEMNGRPRKTLGWLTPFEVYSQWLARLEHSPDVIQ